MIVPVKRLSAAKSRLRGALGAGKAAAARPAERLTNGGRDLADAPVIAEVGPPTDDVAPGGSEHELLVLAMALDTMAAALASPVVGRVVVVTADPTVGEEAALLGAEIITDVPDAGLNPALAYAAAQVRRTRPGSAEPGVAALTADIPALRTEDLTAALREAERVGAGQTQAWGGPRSFVTDAAGSGTVLLAAPPASVLEPCFGGDSAVAHTASGAVLLTGDWPSLRRDVDTPADLHEAVALGVGLRTAAALAANLWQPPSMLAPSSTDTGEKV